ncbi:MAG: N-6 DNA methylase [Acidimicrobiaceae bacterium]|nr:N-6 DNA methylase [Acidimicrobiaceae bacterium]
MHSERCAQMPTMTSPGTGGDLLECAYRELELEQGVLLQTSDQPSFDTEDWESFGEWLMLAHRMKAERVFFVEDDPVIMFTRLPSSAGEAEILAAYRRAWSLARPQCLFLATEHELRVYALTAPPARSVDEPRVPKPIEIVTSATQVAEVLSQYHREKIESGALFDEKVYASRDGRADARLLHDVRAANDALVEEGLPPAVAHSLIERVILVRYLEDRSIVTPRYFEEVAGGDGGWLGVLETVPETPQLGAQSTFVSCLADQDFTYAVFDRLQADFNGDLFRVESEEQIAVQQQHLDLVGRLLTGSGLGAQDPLFLWAYDFGVVPASLISSMYEQFYRTGANDEASTHYTPPELVEFALARALTRDVLETNPRICDPACGSGIFLVEAFRRLVHHARLSKQGRLDPEEIKELLLTRLAGVDVNPEAIRLAAFSLYLAYLNYLEPRDIRRAGPLPHLIRNPGADATGAVLVHANAFAPTSDESGSEGTESLPWDARSFDVVLGNPPWGEPRSVQPQLGEKWVRERGFPVGDRDPSQQFLWRSLSLLKQGGIGALLINATAFLNSRSTSQQFRSLWLKETDLQEIVDFTSSRSMFFDGGIAPFMLLVFRPQQSEPSLSTSGIFSYSTVRPSRSLEATRTLAHAHLERRWVYQSALANREYLWKMYAWGNHHDEAFMARLDTEQRLTDFLPDDPVPGWGYQRGGDTKPSDGLSSLRSLKWFNSWGPLELSTFEEPPVKVKRQPDERCYYGQRIVIAQGVRSGFGPAARLETPPFSFRAIIYCLPLQSVPTWKAKTMLGTLLSALGRYRLFMASGSWGVWHDTLLAKDILQLPIRMAEGGATVTKRISHAVDALVDVTDINSPDYPFDAEAEAGAQTLQEVLFELDEAVFDLFDATEAERDLVRDFINHSLPLVGRKTRWFNQPSVAIETNRRGTANDLVESSSSFGLDRYLSVFLHRWNRELAPSGEFTWTAVTSPRAPMVAVVFKTQELGARVVELSETNDETWRSVLDRLGRALEHPMTVSTRIRAAGTLRSVSDRSIVIAKRNQARLWTASAAREDAEATILQAIDLQSTS